MYSPTSYFCGLAVTAYMAICVAAAAVRWFHLCRPYNRKPQYYYPGRPFVVGVLLTALTLLPYAVSPQNPDAWFLARLYFFPVTLYHFTILLYAYFGGVMQWHLWRAPMSIIGTPVALALLAAVVLALVPGQQATVVWSMYVLGVVITGVCVAAMWAVLRWAGKYDPDDYSNPDDFPVVFARRWSVMIVVNLVLCWAGALANNPVFLAVLMLLIAASVVLFIITALHPHRNRPMEEETAPARKASLEKVLSVITTVVETQEAYLDPHLTIQDVADRSGYSRSHIAGLFKQEFGGFFAYVNRLRLQHVEAYLREHPAASLQEAAEESGFGSRQAYYAVKSRLGK